MGDKAGEVPEREKGREVPRVNRKCVTATSFEGPSVEEK